MSDITRKLAEPFDPAIVSWRVGPTTKDKTKGMALAYIDARDVMRRLDEVCGPENWQDDYPWSDGKRVVCRIGIKIGEEWIWKTDGAGDTDTEGEKGALSDAFKRSAVKWGIGRYLYDVESPWVQIKQQGNSYVIADGEHARLRARLPHPGRGAAAPAREREADPFSPPPVNGTGPQTASAVPAAPINRAALPATAEQPPEVTAARLRIRGLIDAYDHRIKTAPNGHALELVMDDGRDELAEIEAAGEPGKAAADKLRDKFMRRMAEFDEGMAA